RDQQGLDVEHYMERDWLVQHNRRGRAALHSWRSASMGSTLEARRAGTAQASSATTIQMAPTLTCVVSAVAWIPACADARARVSGIESSSPIITPAAAMTRPCHTTSRKIAERAAPRAMRTPISRVRRLTRYA